MNTSELRLEEYVMPAVDLGPENPLVPFHNPAANQNLSGGADPAIDAEVVRNMAHRDYDGCLPYTLQSNYGCQRPPRNFRVAVLENEILRATFLLDLGGRMWSLIHKASGRELLYVNRVFQPRNLAIRNAWFAGGVEWNFCWPGHTPFTCSPVFAARLGADDGTPVLRMYEWERYRQMPFQIDAFLPAGSAVLYVRVRLANPHDRMIPVYWWSNAAVPQRAGARMLAPAVQAYRHDYSGKLVGLEFPKHDDRDLSYPVNHRDAADCYMRLQREQRPWIAHVEADGIGLFHASTNRLRGRKMFVFGTSVGGERWQDVLSPEGGRYLEIQGGLTTTQTECLPMPARAEWSWLEAYGSIQTDPSSAHSPDWTIACGAVQREIATIVPDHEMQRTLAETQAMSRRAPDQILHRGSGWGALERLRRERADERPLCDRSVVFDDVSLTALQEPWLRLLEGKPFPESAPDRPPEAWMVQSEWRELLQRSIAAGPSDHWLAWLHLGVMHLAGQQLPQAEAAWDASLERKASAWALRNLGLLARDRGDLPRAARLYRSAVELVPNNVWLVVEFGQILLDAGLGRQWLDVAGGFSGSLLGNGRIRLLSARAAMQQGDLDAVARFLGDPSVAIPDLREGDNTLSDLWFAFHERRLAGRAPVDEAIVQKVRLEFPPPRHLDFRMHVGRRTDASAAQARR